MNGLARFFPLAAVIAVVGFLLSAAGPVSAADVPPHVATVGGDVVIYTHRFKPEEFAKALKLVTDGFTEAQKAAGQTRHNYFLVDEANATVVVVSFFGPGESVEGMAQVDAARGCPDAARAAPPRAARLRALHGERRHGDGVVGKSRSKVRGSRPTAFAVGTSP